MNIDGYKNLTDMARNAKMTPETVSQFRNVALQTVDHAIDTFFKPEREVAEGKQAYDQMTDLQRALNTYASRAGQEAKDVSAASNQDVRQFDRDGSKEEVGACESMLPSGKPLTDGIRQMSDVYATQRNHAKPVSTDEQAYMQTVAANLGKVLPLFGSVAMVPGPLSLSLKDHIKETMQWSLQGNSSSSSLTESDSFRLLTLSAAKKRISSSSSGSVAGGGKAETTTVDERVLPGMHEIRKAIAGIGFSKANTQHYKVTQKITEYDRKTETEGAWLWKKEVTRTFNANSGEITLGEGTLTTDPDRMTIFSVRGNDGLEHPGSGADIVDLVSKSELNNDFLDSFRDKAQGLIDGAVGTLFNPKREVSEGRKSYDELANLQRALELAQSKWGVQDYHGGLPGQIKNINELAPLYACVAMVPGEMSSSVKNHAKSLYQENLQAKSGSVSQGYELSGSLLTGSLAETRSGSVESSDFSKSFKQETTTTDELIMPKLHDLKVQLDQLTISRDGHLFIPSPSTRSY